MDRYSLLKLRPTLQHQLPQFKNTLMKRSVMRGSLYGVLEGVAEGVKGVRVRVRDGEKERLYEVDKYERTKAGLLGRVWLTRVGTKNTQSMQVTDVEALGLKWTLEEQKTE